MTADVASSATQPPRRWRNWSGLVEFTPARFAQPGSLAELQAVVRDAGRQGRSLRVTGSGHSFVPLVQTEGVQINLDRLTGIIETGELSATVWAGTKLKVLGETLAQQGYGMMNLGDINKQAIAGAVATGTHGTGASLGSISTQVQALTLVLADGETMHCAADENPDLFAAARVSLGALGVIAQLRLGLRPAYRLRLQKKAMPLQDCLTLAPRLAAEHRHFEFYWFPHTEMTVVKLMDECNDAESHRALTTLNELVLENGVFGLVSRIARARPQWAPRIAQLIGMSMKGDEGTMVADCHRAFATTRLVRFHEMEYELPAERGPEVLRELAEFVRKQGILVHFPVEYRYVRGDDIWLSPFYGRDSVAISVHQYVGMDYERYFQGAEAIFRNHGGRPHWGKMHNLRARELARLYPRWDDFCALRARLDPHGRFLNPYLRQLFGL